MLGARGERENAADPALLGGSFAGAQQALAVAGVAVVGRCLGSSAGEVCVVAWPNAKLELVARTIH